MATTRSICVVIAAKDASPTIARAVRSALNEPEVAEVFVIDDGSSDATGATAQTADDGSNRLRVVHFEQNRGPAAARNHAIAASSAPLIAVLDADDFFLPGRFRHLLSLSDWDFVADNIAFIDERRAEDVDLAVAEFQPASMLIDTARFIEGNISRRGNARGETGFLKPVMRRDFLERNSLRYREDLRLGEDYDLYLRALTKGARYRISHVCGYGAVVRRNSLSGHHRTEDLRRLYEADRAVLGSAGLSREVSDLIRRHERHVRGRYELRHFLDLKNSKGRGAALGYAFLRPRALPSITAGILADKVERFRKRSTAGNDLQDDGTRLRYLLPGTQVPQR